MKMIRSFAVVLVMVLCLSSCKKQKITESEVTFTQPMANQKFSPGDVIKLEATAFDSENIMRLNWFIIGPGGDTVKTMEPSIRKNNLGISYKIDDEFKHGVSSFSTGKFKWVISVSNKFVTQDFIREIQIGEKVNIVSNFTIAQLYNSSGQLTTYLYNANLEELRNYKLPARSNYYNIRSSGAFGKFIYYYDYNASEIRRYNGYDGSDDELLFDDPGNQPNFISQDYLYVTQADRSNNTQVFNKAGDKLFKIDHQYSYPEKILKVQDVILTVENNHVVVYNASNGSYQNSLLFSSSLFAFGLFSFGDKTKVYILARDPSNSSAMIIRRYNAVDNSAILFNGNYSFRPLWQNPINVSSSKVWIFSTDGLYQFSSDEQMQQMNISALNGASDISAYMFHSSSSTLVYRTFQDVNHFYNYSAQNYKGEIRGEPVLFLE